MKWRIAFSFFVVTIITFVSGLVMASPAGMHNMHGLGKPKIAASMAPTGLYTCSLNELGWLYCWGSNVAGQYGNNTTTGMTKPVPIRSGFLQIDTARTIAGSSSGTTYAITVTGVLMSWGDNIYGKLGTNSAAIGASFTPQVVDSGTRYIFVKSQYRQTCAITTTNALKCWGYNSDGEVGDGTTTQRNSPVIIDAGVTYKTVAVGGYHTCAITTGGVLKCWGLNDNYQLGDGTTNTKTAPVVIDSGVSYASVSVGLTHSCGITTTNQLKCWGNDSNGQVGDGGVIIVGSKSTPYVIDSGVSYSQVSAADDSNCAITTTGLLKCWGLNSSGQLGDSSTSSRSSPVVIDSGSTYVSISSGGTHTCGITNAKIMKCWGQNDAGQLGIGSLTNQTSPQVVTP